MSKVLINTNESGFKKLRNDIDRASVSIIRAHNAFADLNIGSLTGDDLIAFSANPTLFINTRLQATKEEYSVFKVEELHKIIVVPDHYHRAVECGEYLKHEQADLGKKYFLLNGKCEPDEKKIAEAKKQFNNYAITKDQIARLGFAQEIKLVLDKMIAGEDPITAKDTVKKLPSMFRYDGAGLEINDTFVLHNHR